MKAIACVDKNMGIGRSGELLVRIKEDMKFFRKTTIGHPVIMGKKTFLSLKEPLKDRENIVLSRTLSGIIHENVTVCNDYQQLINMNDAFVIGGGEIYKLFLPYCDEIYLTEVNETYEADTFFPSFDKNLYNVEILEENELFSIKKYTKK